ncbi:MAG TPA: response regulator [Coleofasciculaceae cyanobacterium]
MMITKTILLINSELNVREVMHACLSHLGGWQVFSTGSPSQGLQDAVLNQPDVIIFDLSTFGMNFLTFLQKLQAQPATRNIPIVLVAAGLKWLNSELLEQFPVVGVIDDFSDPIKLPQQIAKLLGWDEEPQLIEGKSYSSHLN